MNEQAVAEGSGTFTVTAAEQSHRVRSRQILAAHPGVRILMGRDPTSFGWTIVLVALQLGIAIGLSVAAAPWWGVMLAAYCIGAFANHALTVLIHEYTHNLVFRTALANRLAAILANFPIVLPVAMSFRSFHMLHHEHLGHPGLDADVPGDLEARWVGRSRWRKLLWVAAYPMVILFLRTGDVKTQPVLERWTLLNAAAMAAGLVPLIWVFGWTACAYLLLSTLLALGLHPVGGRWFQEHYVVREGQETYSYYGVLNRLCFNMGYHNEHHDFPGVAWSRLPALRRAAPEFYDSLYAHRSWCLLLLRVIFDASFSPANRIVRFDQVRPGSQPDAGA